MYIYIYIFVCACTESSNTLALCGCKHMKCDKSNLRCVLRMNPYWISIYFEIHPSKSMSLLSLTFFSQTIRRCKMMVPITVCYCVL